MSRRAVLLAVAVALPGCSMGLHSVPTHHRDGDSVDCSRSYALPVFDGVIAAGSAGIGGAALAANRGMEESKTLTTVAAVALPLAVITAISAKRGFDSVRRCRKANAATQRRRFGAISARARPDHCRAWRDAVFAATPEKRRALADSMPSECL